MARTDLILYLGETWTVDGVATDKDGNAINLTDGKIEFRIAGQETLALKLISGADTQVQITEPASGVYLITLEDTDPKQAAVAPGQYIYEVVSITDDHGVTVQNRGIANVYKSLRKQFP